MSFDVEVAFKSIMDTMTTNHSDNSERFEKLEEKLNMLSSDVKVIQTITADVKHDIYGNGNVGLKVRQTKTEEQILGLYREVDEAKTVAYTSQGKTQKIESNLSRFMGVIIGVNFIVGALFAILINWEKLKRIFPDGG